MATSILVPDAAKIGDAVLVGQFENGSPEWHAARKTGIGGSDVSTICGLNPWTSAFALFCRKTGRIPEQESNSSMEWGTRLEPVIAAKFADEHPELSVSASPGTYAHKDRPWQLANPDGILVDEAGKHGILEIKTAKYEDDWRNGVPLYYQTQVQWYLQTFGFEYAFVAVLFSGSMYREFYVAADEFQQQANLEQVIRFKAYLDADIEPDYDGASSTYEAVRLLHPDIEDAEVELGDLGVSYMNALSDLADAEKKATELKSRVMGAMGKAKRGLIYDEPAVTRQAKGGGAPYLVMKRK